MAVYTEAYEIMKQWKQVYQVQDKSDQLLSAGGRPAVYFSHGTRNWDCWPLWDVYSYRVLSAVSIKTYLARSLCFG